MTKGTSRNGRFVTLKSGRVIFIPKGYKKKWADVRDKIGAGGREGTYQLDIDEEVLTIHRVPKGGELSEKALSSLGDRPQVSFNTEDKTWHFVSPEHPAVRHSSWAHGVLGREMRGYDQDTLLVGGFLDRKTGKLEIYGDTDSILEDAISDPLEARRSANRARRALGMAKVSLFTLGGVEPKVEEIETPVWGTEEEEEWW